VFFFPSLEVGFVPRLVYLSLVPVDVDIDLTY
jgi:hypothetical protein